MILRYIFIVLFLVSFGSASMGGVGDVYYCEVEKNFSIWKHSLKNEKNDQPKRFKFRIQKKEDTKDNLIIKYSKSDRVITFDSNGNKLIGGWLDVKEAGLRKGFKNITVYATSDFGGFTCCPTFYYTDYGFTSIKVLTAECSPF